MDDSLVTEEVEPREDAEGQVVEDAVDVPGDSTSDNGNSVDTVDGGLSADDVQRIVSDTVGTLQRSQDVQFAGLSEDVSALGESISLLAASDEGQSSEGTTLVRVDSSQVETAKGALRVLCTEGLLVVILLALIAGLQGWRIVADRWRG